MQVYPDPYLDVGDALPWVSLLIVAGFVAGALTAGPGQPVAAAEPVGLALLLMAALPATESLLGRAALAVVLVGCVAIAAVLGWFMVAGTDTTSLVAGTGVGLVGAALGALGLNRMRPLFVIPGKPSRWTLPSSTSPPSRNRRPGSTDRSTRSLGL